jgi:hypothetical protein
MEQIKTAIRICPKECKEAIPIDENNVNIIFLKN